MWKEVPRATNDMAAPDVMWRKNQVKLSVGDEFKPVIEEKIQELSHRKSTDVTNSKNQVIKPRRLSDTILHAVKYLEQTKNLNKY